MGLKQFEQDPWTEGIPSRFRLGDDVKGGALRITDFGILVELEGGVEGLIYSSEIVQPSTDEAIKEDDTLEARIIKIDTNERKIGLSMKNLKNIEG